MARAYKVCVLNESDAQSLLYGGIAHKCSSRRHHHCSRAIVDELVKNGELQWVGKHKRVATYVQARSWQKTYRRNASGDVIECSMQLVRGGGR